MIRAKLRHERGPEVIKTEQNKQKVRNRDKLIVEKGPAHIRKQENNRTLASRKRKVEDDPEHLKSDEIKRKRLSRNKQRVLNPEKVKEDQRKWQKRSRLVDSQKKRLQKFREHTMLNAIFTCSCCQRNLFDCNVCKLDFKLITKIEGKKTGIFEKSIESQIEINVNGKISS